MNDKSVFANFWEVYESSRPFSHIFSVISIIILAMYTISTNVNAFLRIDQSIFIEGVVVGVDENGELQKLSRINPIVATNIQLEEDLSELIYESLVRVDQNGSVIPVLADYLEIEKGRTYQFKLRDDVYWHDGEKLTTEDVRATFDLVGSLESATGDISMESRAVQNLELSVIDEYSFKIEINGVIPGFFEAISFKIMPAHWLDTATPENLSSSDPIINRRPVGTGPFKFNRATDLAIELVSNKQYREVVKLERVQFRLYKDQKHAVDALRSGQIHALTGVSNGEIEKLEKLGSLQVLRSNVIYNQYWALYFNLGEGGPAIFKELAVRQAIAQGINKNRLIEVMLGNGEQALGPIPVSSFAYTKQKTYEFDQAAAKTKLENAGWKLEKGKIHRTKAGAVLEFDMIVVDNPDRLLIAEVIRQDLEEIGVKMNIKAENVEDIKNQYLVTRQFNSILYGVETFIDPDRFELFHSSEVIYPGLNIGSYISSRQVTDIIDGEQKKVPQVDSLLDDARRLIGQEDRKRKYDIFLSVIAEEVPAVFLFHPKENYVVNRRVKGIELNELSSLEDRFINVADWEVKVN